MPSYTAPVEDMMFLFEKLRNNKNYNELEKYKDVSPDLVKDILQEAAKINQNLILPLAKAGDENPAVLENGVVRTPPGYKEAYTKYIEDGWTSLSCDPKYGGQGMPKTVSAFFDEMLSSASLSFKLYSELSIGAYNCINHHATEDIKNKYLPKIVEGKWSGTMCLTEPVCGTDLGLLKTKAKKQSDGTYKLTGQKIFITSGDHDLTENIIHLVLARADDSPAGTKGISLFLVPKFIVKDDGTIGPRNGISTGSIETKMGIKGSATCVLNFDDATGYMIGDKEKGLSAMFTMMNLERIVVGIQAFEWGKLIHEGVRPWENPFGAPQFGSFFFMITGFHGTHVSIGVIFLFIYAYKTFAGHYDEGKRGWFTTMKGDYVEIEILGLYWHFVDLVWVFIFAFFYLW